MYLTLGGILCSLLFLSSAGFLNTFYGSLQLLLVLQFTYVLLFFKRLKKTMDYATNKVFDTYTHFPSSISCANDTQVSIDTIRSSLQDENYKTQSTKETEAHISLVNMPSEKLALINILNNQILMKTNGVFVRTFAHLLQVSEVKRYNYPLVADLVIKSEKVKRAIERTAMHQIQESDSNDDEFYQHLIKRNQRRAIKLLFNMRSTLSDFLLRFTSWILYKLLPCFLNSVVVDPDQVKQLRESSTSNLPLIFLPLHRSHLDYILLSFILLNNNVRSPLVAAGDNLRIPFFGSLLRGLGAFFIKRRIDPVMGHQDYVYKAILQTYMNLCLKAGHNIEIFIEGGRTRTGKPCMPKYGLLSVILETFMDGTIEDALLVPVSINYEKLVDGNFIKEQLGEPKKRETFSTSLKGIWHVLNSNFGMMKVDFNQPLSLRELIKTFELNKNSPKSSGSNRVLKSNPSTNSLYGTDVISEEHKTLVENISKHIIYDCAQSATVMSTNALAFLLLTRYRNGASLEQLAYAFKDLEHELEFVGKHLGLSGDLGDVINYAVDLLGPALVKKKKQNNLDIIKPITILPNVIELSYYSNSLVAHFALESVIALALRVSEIKFETVSHDDLMENAMQLCNFFQYEFLFCKPCQSLEQVITSSVVDLFVRKEILVLEENTVIIDKNRKLAAQFIDEETETLSRLYKLNTSKNVLEKIQYLGDIIMPFVETYALTAFTLNKLVQRQLLESELIGGVLEEMKNQLDRGSLKYNESIAVDSIKNALKLYQKWGVLECHNENRLRIYNLKDSYDDTELIRDVYNKVNKYQTNNLFCYL